MSLDDEGKVEEKREKMWKGGEKESDQGRRGRKNCRKNRERERVGVKEVEEEELLEKRERERVEKKKNSEKGSGGHRESA